MSLISVGQQITVYSSFFLLITGLFGNGMMIFIFSSTRAYRTTPCSFYFLVGSTCNVLYLLVNLPLRILADGYANDITNVSSFLCKGRPFMTLWIALICFTCSCLSIIDQFFVTSQSVSLRRCSQIKWAYRIVFISIIIWCLHAIPAFIFFDISPNATITKCLPSSNYGTYVSIYILVLISAIPILIMIIFGCLTYRNIRQTIILVEQRVDRLMITMTLIQVGLIVISNSPIGVIYAYGLITRGVTKSIKRQIEENFVTLIFTLISYFYYVGNFYAFFILSTRFQRTVKKRLCRRRRSNQIVSAQQLSLATSKFNEINIKD